jgi:hypothetical protein
MKIERVSSWRLEMCRMVRESCYTMAADPAAVGPGDPLATYNRTLATVALEVPIPDMARWFVRTETVLGNMRLAMSMVEQNLEAAEAMAGATGSVEVTYDGVTWERGTLE